MRINNKSMKCSRLFDLDCGDIFFKDDHYYIAGEVDYYSCTRKCFDITINELRNFTCNYDVIAWDRNECELIIK